MKRIAVCDDNEVELEEIHREVKAYTNRNAGVIEVTPFSKPINLMESMIETGNYDIYILDVEMPGMDGFILARKIREKDPYGILIFLTSHMDRAVEGYPVRAFRYLDKACMKKELLHILDDAMDEAEKQPRTITFRWNHDIIRVRISEIIMVVSVSRAVEVVTVHERFRVNRRMHDIFDELNDPRFMIIDRGAFVNLNYVERVNAGEIKLMNGESLPVSRRARPKILSRILSDGGISHELDP